MNRKRREQSQSMVHLQDQAEERCRDIEAIAGLLVAVDLDTRREPLDPAMISHVGQMLRTGARQMQALLQNLHADAHAAPPMSRRTRHNK